MCDEDMLLYWTAGAPGSWKVTLTLEEMGRYHYQSRELPYDDTEHEDPDVRRLNPAGKVPILCDGEMVLTDPVEMCRYIANKYTDNGRELVPTNISLLEAMDERILAVVRLEKTILTDIVQYKSSRKACQQDKTLLADRYDVARRELTQWETYMSQQQDTSFVVGKSFTLADAVVFPIVAILFRLGLNAAKYPALAFYYSQQKKRSSIQNTWPHHWLTSPNLSVLSNL